ncbi:MAG TPA: adenylate/guanylate cyclase domain-containing protein [Candidatus Binatia bacterium]|nr:adenylate/guanylate cyclase domain-containing protein [Candidatus Binatia bacterium]
MPMEERALDSTLLDRLVWALVQAAVDAVRYQPPHLKVLQACEANQPEVPAPVAHWLAELQARPSVVELGRLPHAVVRQAAAIAARSFGPTASALIRFLSGATAGAVDRAGAVALERPIRARAHPGLLVPHPHDVAVLALDMRGFTGLTEALHDTQYLVDLLEEYLTALTRVVESHRGVVFQYTGDGFLALFLPELSGRHPAAMLDGLVHEMCPQLHQTFDDLHARWRAEWRDADRTTVPIGLGVGMSFGRVTLGFIGPSGKKQLGAIGEPINLAAVMCASAVAGTVLVDRAAFVEAGVEPLHPRLVRIRSRKLGRRIEAVCFRFGGRLDG